MTFQEVVYEWCIQCHGPTRSNSTTERSLRFMEESIELFQAVGMPKEKIIDLVEYVYSKPTGESFQEIGGVMVTLAALCESLGHSMEFAGETELKRIWRNIDKIREKQKGKISAELGE